MIERGHQAGQPVQRGRAEAERDTWERRLRAVALGGVFRIGMGVHGAAHFLTCADAGLAAQRWLTVARSASALPGLRERWRVGWVLHMPRRGGRRPGGDPRLWQDDDAATATPDGDGPDRGEAVIAAVMPCLSTVLVAAPVAMAITVTLRVNRHCSSLARVTDGSRWAGRPGPWRKWSTQRELHVRTTWDHRTMTST